MDVRCIIQLLPFKKENCDKASFYQFVTNAMQINESTELEMAREERN